MIILFTSNPARGIIDEDHPHHSFFNSTLLNDGGLLIDIIPAGAVYYGVNSSFEIGTASLLFLGGSPNLIAKHKMFDLGIHQITFTSISGFIPKKTVDESNNLEIFGLYSVHGVVDGWKINDRWTLNLGLVHGYALLETYQDLKVGRVKSRVTLDAYAALMGFDLNMSSDLHLNIFALSPMYFDMDIVSDVGDGELSLVADLKNLRRFFIFNTSFVKAWRSFHFEVGVFHANSLNTPYVSALWRFL